MIEKAFAKLNLTLEIVGKDKNYHLLESIVVPINIYDTLVFEKANKDEVISDVDIEENNIYKALKLFKETFKIKENVKITLTKRIPIGYGLGGSSANISATLRGLNRLFELNYPLTKLEPLANKLGSDTLFCLYQQRSFIYGRGNKIILSEYKGNDNFTIILPKTYLLTKDVFEKYIGRNNYIGFKTAFINDDYQFINENSKNDLLEASLSLSNELSNLYQILIQNEFKPKLTGSGPALYMVNLTETEIKKVKLLVNKSALVIFAKEI